MFGGYGTGLEKTKKGEVIMKLRDMMLLVVGGLLVIIIIFIIIRIYWVWVLEYSGMVLNTLISDVEDYTTDEEQDDDITLVAVRVS